MNRPSVHGDAGLAPAVGLIRSLSALPGVQRRLLVAPHEFDLRDIGPSDRCGADRAQDRPGDDDEDPLTVKQYRAAERSGCQQRDDVRPEAVTNIEPSGLFRRPRVETSSSADHRERALFG